MPVFGKTSKSRLYTCHPDLIMVAEEAIKYFDFSILVGHRTKERQDELYRGGFSKLKWPNSRHNKSPSLAFDLAPWPIPRDWDTRHSRKRFNFLAGTIFAVARSNGIELRWGGDWKRSDLTQVNSWDDLAHFELTF